MSTSSFAFIVKYLGLPSMSYHNDTFSDALTVNPVTLPSRSKVYMPGIFDDLYGLIDEDLKVFIELLLKGLRLEFLWGFIELFLNGLILLFLCGFIELFFDGLRLEFFSGLIDEFFNGLTEEFLEGFTDELLCGFLELGIFKILSLTHNVELRGVPLTDAKRSPKT
jgi:hypothetical protein